MKLVNTQKPYLNQPENHWELRDRVKISPVETKFEKLYFQKSKPEFRENIFTIEFPIPWKIGNWSEKKIPKKTENFFTCSLFEETYQNWTRHKIPIPNMINVSTPFNVIQYTFEIKAQVLSIFKFNSSIWKSWRLHISCERYGVENRPIDKIERRFLYDS